MHKGAFHEAGGGSRGDYRWGDYSGRQMGPAGGRQPEEKKLAAGRAGSSPGRRAGPHRLPSRAVSKKKQRQWIGPTGLNQNGERQQPRGRRAGSGVLGRGTAACGGSRFLPPR